MTAAAIYCRISKAEADDRLGVDRQERSCRDIAAQHGLSVAHVLIDNDVSAYDRRKPRPQFERLVELLKAGEVGAVVTYHADRLYRRAADLERLVDIVESTRATVHTVAAGDVDLGSASGQMVARMLGAAAQHESARMGERLRMKTDELAAAGLPPGGRPPYGYSKGYVVNPDEAATVRHIAARVLEGASCLSLARELDAMGAMTREGRPWHSSTVRAVVVNPAVAGLRVHRREIAGPGQWEAILDRPTWEHVRATVADPARKRTRPARRYVLAGLVRSVEGDPLNGRPERDGRAYGTRWGARVATSIDADKLEEFVQEAARVALAEWQPTDEPTPAAADVAALEAELDELADLRGRDVISMREWLAAREPIMRRLEDARSAVAPARRGSRVLESPDLAAAWEGASIDERRQALAAVIESVVVHRATRGRWTRIDERVEIRWRHRPTV